MKTIGIYLGPFLYNRKWDEKNLEIGFIGGSEIWAIELANEFANKGDIVYIFGEPENNHTSDKGVKYVNYFLFKEYTKNIKFDHIIMSRRVDALYDEIPCDSIYLMCHDTVIINVKTKDDLKLNKIKKICQQSLFQKEYLKFRYSLNDNNFMRTYQAIDINRYSDVEFYKKKNKMLFSSGKERGSKWLVEKVFPLIKSKVPDFELNLCGYHLQYVEECYKQDGINILGNITKDELIKEQKESKIWIYPNHGYENNGNLCAETFSITAIENAVAKCACILGDWGCFHTTLENYKYFVGNGLYDDIFSKMKPENLDKFAEVIANEAVKCLTDDEYRLKLVEDSYNIAKKYTWEMVAESFRNEWDNDNIKTLLCCICRNENKYIREYVEYYKMFGFTNICLYDNNYDGEDNLYDVIGDYIESGFVILKDYRNKTVCQLESYNECYKEYNDKYDWIAFLDADEFLTFTNEKYSYIYDYLKQDMFKPYDMIHVNWLTFGDCDNVYYKNESLFTRFNKHVDINKKVAYDFPENFHIKSIIRGGLGNAVFDGNSHTIQNIDFNCCNENGQKVDSKSPFLNYSFENLCIRHFSTKTIDEYCEKMIKGFPDQLWNGSRIKELLETRFFRINKITKEKINVVKDKLGIDMCYLLPTVFNGVKNEDVKIFSLCYEKKDFQFLDNEVITPLQVGASNGKDVCELKDNVGDNISDKNYFYIENTGTYWIWKNVKAKYKGQMQYRRPLDGVDNNMDFEDIFSKYDVITCIPFNHPENSKPTKDNPYYIPAKTVEEGYIFSNCIDDIGILEMIINIYYPEYKESYKKYIKNGENLYYSNGFIMRGDDYNRYCEFLFGCLEKYQTFVDVSTFDKLFERVKTNMELGKYPKHMRPETRTYEGIRWQTSIGGFLSERIWTLWLLHNFKEENILKLPYNKMENGMYT